MILTTLYMLISRTHRTFSNRELGVPKEEKELARKVEVKREAGTKQSKQPGQNLKAGLKMRANVLMSLRGRRVELTKALQTTTDIHYFSIWGKKSL